MELQRFQSPAVITVGGSNRRATESGLVEHEGKPPSVAGSYVPEVDALRCLAMTAVIAEHCKLLPAGWMGVWLFFVISGFAVTTSLFSAKHEAHGVWRRIGAFCARRAIRIWPIYFGYIALSAAFILAFRPHGNLAEVPWLMTFTQNIKMIVESYKPGTVWNGFAHLWTISVEQQFYLVFPLLLLLPGRLLRTIALVCVIALAPVLRFVTGAWCTTHGYDPLHAAFAVYAFAPAQFDAFAAGSLIALYRREIAANAVYARVAGAAALAVSVTYVVTYLVIDYRLSGHLSIGDFRNILSGILFGQGRQIWAYYVPTSVSAALLMSLLIKSRLLIKFCRLPGLQAVGRISYGGYLYHVAVLSILGSLVPVFAAPVSGVVSCVVHIGLFVCAYAVTVVLAQMSYTYIERPLIRVGSSR